MQPMTNSTSSTTDSSAVAIPAPRTRKPGKLAFILGWVLSALPILLIGVSNLLMVAFGVNREMSEKGMAEQGFAPETVIPVAIAGMLSAFLYAIPQTALLGTILLTGFFGGAVCVHVMSQDGMWFAPVIAGVITWLGIYLRDPRVRDLVPIRKPL